MRVLKISTLALVVFMLIGCNSSSSSGSSTATTGLTVPTNISAVPAND